MDAETVTLIGRNRLVEQLAEAGIDVAIPTRERGIDLVIMAELRDTFALFPVQLKASCGRSFSIDQKFERIPDLLHVFVWGVGTNNTAVYALTHREAVGVADAMGYSLVQSGQRGLYATQQPSKSLVEHLERFRMTPEEWQKKISAMAIERESVAV